MPTILVIDDDPITGKLIQHISSAHGVACFVTDSAEEGLPMAHHIKPTAIFVDLQLNGEVNGWEAIQRIKNDINLQATQVIAISAGDHFTSAMKAGSDCYLQKPFVATQLLDVILQ